MSVKVGLKLKEVGEWESIHCWLSMFSFWIILAAYLMTCGSLLVEVCVNGSMILRMPIFSNSCLHSLYTHKLPMENNAILLGDYDGPLSLATTSKSCFKAPCLIRSLHNVFEFLTKFPSAPAALALVFSSGSFNNSTRSGTHGLKCSYSTSLWKPAFPTAKHANFLVLRSGSRQHSIAAEINPYFRSFS